MTYPREPEKERRARQRKVFRQEWVKIFALTPDDAIIDHILDAIERV
ncbi:MAG: hypothetical protein PHC68_17890 [Syntrophorhabdaceae bacterium]|nr:hypothetical protein [Syntrophorhabdaceae bacterium]